MPRAGIAAAVDAPLVSPVRPQVATRPVAAVWETFLLAVALASVFAERVTVGGAAIGRVLAPVLVVTAVFGWLRTGRQAAATAPVLFALAYSVWAVASGLWTTSAAGTVEQVGSLAVALSFMAAFAALLSERGQLRSLFLVVVLSATVSAAGEIVAYAIDPGGRAGAGVGDPNFLAAYLLISLPLVLVLAAEAISAETRIALGAAAVVITLGILATLSRGGLLALGVLFATALVLPARALFGSLHQKRRALVAVAAVVALVFALGGAGAARFETLYHHTGTGAGRENTWAAAWSETSRRPWLGLGYGAFVRESNDLMRSTPGVDLQDFELRPNGTEAHSAYLGSLADVGVPGFALFVALLVATGAALWRTALVSRARGDLFLMRASLGLFAGLVAWSAASIFLSTETSRPLWIVVGIAAALPRLRR
jgi:O-antigen ligase